MTKPVNHSHSPSAQFHHAPRTGSDGKSSAPTSVQEASVSKSVPNGNTVPNRNFTDELAAMLDDGSANESTKTNTTAESDPENQGTQDAQGRTPEPSAPGGESTSTVNSNKLGAGKVGTGKGTETGGPDSLIKEFSKSSLGLLQTSVKFGDVGGPLKAGSRGRSSNSDSKQENVDRLSANSTDAGNPSRSQSLELNITALIPSPLAKGVSQPLLANTASASAVAEGHAIDRTSASEDTSSLERYTPVPSELRQVQGLADANNAGPTYDAFTLELKQKSSAKDTLSSASAVSSANSRDEVTSQISAAASGDALKTAPVASASALTNVSVNPGVGQQAAFVTPFGPPANGSKSSLLSSKQSTAKPGNTETPLAEKGEPQETEMVEGSPISISPSTTKSKLADAATTGQLSAAPSDKRKQGESGADDSRPSAPVSTDLRGAASQEWRPGNQIRTVSEKDQSFVPVRPNGNQDPVAGGSVKQIVLKVEDSSGQNVSVRLSERGSQVALGVRSSDPVVAAALKQDLPSLVGSLDRAGWKLDSSAPMHTIAGSVQTSSAQQSADDQQSQGNQAPEWNYEQQGKKRPIAELWEEVLNRQSSY